jgi:hypothetical protein
MFPRAPYQLMIVELRNFVMFPRAPYQLIMLA